MLFFWNVVSQFDTQLHSSIGNTHYEISTHVEYQYTQGQFDW